MLRHATNAARVCHQHLVLDAVSMCRITVCLDCCKAGDSWCIADALEHAAWTKGAKHMQPLRDDLDWFQHSSIDVTLFVGAAVTTVLAVGSLTLVLLARKVYYSWLSRFSVLSHVTNSCSCWHLSECRPASLSHCDCNGIADSEVCVRGYNGSTVAW